MRSAVRVLVWGCVAAVLLGGCKKWRARGDDAGVVDAGPRGPLTVAIPETTDHWHGVGTLWQGAADGSQGAVLLLHQLGSNRAEWGMLVQRLQRPPAITVLALDLRGHGESVRGPRSERQTWETFGEDPARWEGVATDAVAGAQYLFNSGGARSIVVVGSSIGASAALAGLADEPRVVGLAMISPGLAYHGIDVRDPMLRYVRLRTDPPRTAWMMAGERDAESALALATLATATPDALAATPDALATQAPAIVIERAVIAGTDAHGVSLLNADATQARWASLERYIRTALRPPRRAVDAQH